MRATFLSMILIFAVLVAACEPAAEENTTSPTQPSSNNPGGGFAESKPIRPTGLETTLVTQVIDGDTIEISGGRRVRLIGINTPEREEPLYNEAAAFTRSLLEGQEVGLEPGIEPRDQFDRELFYVWIGDQLANWEIVRAGYASRFAVPPNIQYDAAIEQAESRAIDDQVGLWQRAAAGLEILAVFWDAPGPDDENPNGEYVQISNASSDPVNMTGFRLNDAASNVYVFPAMNLNAGQQIKLYSGCGSDSAAALYWCAGGAVWNNSGDTAYLTDAAGGYIDHYEIEGQ